MFKRKFSLTQVLCIATLAAPWASPCGAQSIKSGLDQNAFDANVRLQDDLYRAVNGTWLERTEIPADKSNYGSFTMLDDLSQQRIREIIESTLAASNPRGSEAQKIADMYRSFMDEPRVEKLGISPLSESLARIDNLQDMNDVIKYFGYAQTVSVSTPLVLIVDQDDKNSTQYIVAMIQSGTTLPDRDYYLQDDEKFVAAREALHSYVHQLFQLANLPDGKNAADHILALEKQLAEVQWERTELRDAEKRYNKFAFADLAKLTPHLNCEDLFTEAQIADRGDVIVTAPSYFEGLDRLLTETPLEIWQQYLKFKVIDAAAPFLSQSFVDAHFDLHQKALAGVPEQKPRWKRGVELIAGAGAGDFGALGDAVGQLYVERHFGAESKARMEQLVANLLTAFDQSIDELTWMTETTKQKAKQKLARISTKIGYTEKWRGYGKLEVDPQDLLGNVVRSQQLEHTRMVEKLGKPIDRDEWGMTPQTVNAYYNPGMNEIVFPAAILQPPFFDPSSDEAANYGGIGAVIGHEISHAFDDQGSKYDGDGNLNNWWNEKDRQEFKQLTSKLVDQYNQYSPLPGKNVNGELTLGENIADLSGLAIAHKAYRLSLQGQTPPEIDGWTGDQRFFMGWGQVWKRKYRDAEMIKRLLTDPHSPSWYRANGPIINIDAFYEAFGVKPGDALYCAPEQRIKIW